jgi:outer membrane biosynthesis protein TonB
MPQSLNLTRNSLLGARIDPSIESGSSGRVGLTVSALLHAGIIAATLLTFSQARLEIEDQSPPVVPVDLVTIGQKTNIAPTVVQKPKEIQQEVQPPRLDQLQMKVPAVPEQSEVAPPDQAPSEPVLQKPRPIPLPKSKPQTAPEPAKKKQAEEDFSALLNKLTTPTAAPRNARVASRTQRGFGAENAMTMELRDALKNQIEQCMDWGVVAGAPNAQNIQVVVDLTLNPDGSVAGSPHLEAESAAEASRNPYVRAAADAALRAIAVCRPYKLPADSFEVWRDSQLVFSPRDVLGQ